MLTTPGVRFQDPSPAGHPDTQRVFEPLHAGGGSRDIASPPSGWLSSSARACAAGLLLLASGACLPSPPVAPLGEFEISGIDIWYLQPFSPRVEVLLVPKKGCPALEEHPRADLNGLAARVHSNPDAFTCRTPVLEFQLSSQPGTAAGLDGVIDFRDGRVVVLQNLAAPRGWTQGGAPIDQVVTAPGYTVALNWSPDTDRLGTEAWFDTSVFPVTGTTVSFVVPAVLPTGWAHMDFVPPVTRCAGFSTCVDLVATGVRGSWSRGMAFVLTPAPAARFEAAKETRETPRE